jgi:predicted dehydrogenase
MKKILKFGLVGVGTHARWAVMKAIEETAQNCELVAACDLMEENLKPLVEQGIPTFNDFNEMIEKIDLDALYICTPCDHHYEPVVAGLRAGLHIVCEKPMADTIEKCESMIAEAEKADRKLIVTFENRYHPEIQKIKEWIEAGHLGKVGAVHSHFFTSSYKTFGDGAARRKRLMDLAGSLDCGIHVFDYIRYLLGGDWKDVQAMGAWFGESLAHAPHISVQARLTTGAMMTLTYSYAYAAYIDKKTMSSGKIVVGDKGVVHFYEDDLRKPFMKLVSETKDETFEAHNTQHTLAIGWLLDDLADCVLNDKPLSAELATAEDGLKAQIVVDEALRQTHENRM